MQLLTPADAASRVASALKGAAAATGAGFDYLMRTATRESSLNATARNPSSSARGLFQFIDSTWLEMLKEEGPRLGLADAAADVTRTASGRYTVVDPKRRAELLAMRDDPRASALLAGAFTRRNAEAFQSAHGRAPTEGELYAAHFLGAQGAIELTTLARNAPEASAADAFPAQAAANRAVFYDMGRARSAREIYDRLTTSPAARAQTAVAAAVPQAQSAATARRSSSDEDVAAFNGGRENDGETFHSLFKTGRRSPVSSYVQQAWSSFGSAGVAADTPAVAGRAGALSYAAPAAPVSGRAASAAQAVEGAARRRFPAWPGQQDATASVSTSVAMGAGAEPKAFARSVAKPSPAQSDAANPAASTPVAPQIAPESVSPKVGSTSPFGLDLSFLGRSATTARSSGRP